MNGQAYKQSIHHHTHITPTNSENRSSRPGPDTSKIMPARTRFQTQVKAKKARIVFLRFPPELRLMIYDHLFRGARVSQCALPEYPLTVPRTFTTRLYGYRDSLKNSFKQPVGDLLSILQTCQTIQRRGAPNPGKAPNPRNLRSQSP